MLMIQKKLWTVTTRVDGDMCSAIHTSQEAVDADVLDFVKGEGYEGADDDSAAIQAFIDDMGNHDGYSEITVEEHTVDISL